MFTRIWGDGPKTAILIHGLASSSLTWRQLAKHLTPEGYTVYAPDLAGHGHSNRSASYSIEAWSEEVQNELPQPDLLLGHSIGGLIAANLTEVFRPKKTVLLDPVFHFTKNSTFASVIQKLFSYQKLIMPVAPHNKRANETLAAYRERLISLSNIRRWDPHTVKVLNSPNRYSDKFLANVEDALLIRAHHSYLFPAYHLTRSVREGLSIETFAGVGHSIHTEAFDRFTVSLDKYLNIEPHQNT